jgi:SAM-dependent methyltransferase
MSVFMPVLEDVNLRKWNESYAAHRLEHAAYDDWIDTYIPMLEWAKRPILDLGCGSGANVDSLYAYGIIPICGDYAIEGLRIVKRIKRQLPVVLFDMREGMPFSDGAFDFIFADLSIHYFNAAITVKIISDIQKALAPDGVFLCRVNSINDTNYGAKEGDEIEPHFYSRSGHIKRFFDENDMLFFFRNWQIISRREYATYKYGNPKYVWEIACKKH